MATKQHIKFVDTYAAELTFDIPSDVSVGDYWEHHGNKTATLRARSHKSQEDAQQQMVQFFESLKKALEEG